MVRPPAFPARSTAGSLISTVWLLPASIKRASCVVPSEPRIEIQVGSEASNWIRTAPGAGDVETFGPAFGTAERSVTGGAVVTGAITGAGTLGAGSEAEITLVLPGFESLGHSSMPTMITTAPSPIAI